MAQTTHLKKSVSIPAFLTATFGTVLLGMLSGLTSGSMRGYGSYVVPPLTPPDVVFPIVWSILYAMIGLSLFFILRQPTITEALARDKNTAIWLWGVQLAFNLLWPYAFFTLRLYTFSFLWLTALVAVNFALIIYAFRVNKLAGALLIPYQAWLMFAAYLNLFIAILN